MRDQHRAKQDLIDEVVALRKQVTDLRETMAARRRVEDALRLSEEQLRALVDGSPAGLCLLRSDGTPVAANRPFARMLGYDSPGELLSVADVLGVFANPEEQARVLELVDQPDRCFAHALFRNKNGATHASWIVGTRCETGEAIALVVLQLSAASAYGRRSA